MIEGKVARVLNARELVINVGARSGVKPGMTFAVLAEKPLEINDPDTGTILGAIDREKVRVRVTDVHDAFAICKTYQTRRIPGRGVSLAELAAAFEYVPERKIPVTLNSEDSALPPPLSQEESYVKLKDRVREVDDVEPPEVS